MLHVSLFIFPNLWGMSGGMDQVENTFPSEKRKKDVCGSGG